MFAQQQIFLGVIICLSITVFGICSTAVFSKTENVRYFTTSSTFTAVSKIDCCRKCRVTAGCEAVNVNRADLTCELVTDTTYIAVAAPGWFTYDIEIAASPCNAGWSHFNNSCYYAVSDQLQWNDAEERCETLDSQATLAAITSSSEQVFVEALIIAELPTADMVWLGGRYDNFGTYWWNFQQAMDTGFVNWGVLQPQASNGEDCIAIMVLLSFTWHDVGCSAPLESICEYSLTAAPPLSNGLVQIGLIG